MKKFNYLEKKLKFKNYLEKVFMRVLVINSLEFAFGGSRYDDIELFNNFK